MEKQNTSQAFNIAFRHLIELEGGYVNDANDRGGETKYGISKRAHPDVDIINLRLDQAKVIYWQDYWCANCCHELPMPLALALFDGVVNHSAVKARRMMQMALGLNPDGVIGPKTKSTAAAANCKQVIVRYLAVRAKYYHQIVLANNSQAKFALGWFKRLFKLHQYIFDQCWPWKL